MRHAVPFALLAVLALGGCGYGGNGERDEVRAVVERFYTAIRADDGEAACEQLNDAAIEQVQGQSGQTCPAVITRLDYEGGRVHSVHVAAVEAQVVMSTQERAYLEREPDGWKLDAVGCRPVPGVAREQPADCEVEV